MMMFGIKDLLDSYKVLDFEDMDKQMLWQLSKQLKFLIKDNAIYMEDILEDIKGPYGLSYFENRDTYIIGIRGNFGIKFTVEKGRFKSTITSVEFIVNNKE